MGRQEKKKKDILCIAYIVAIIVVNVVISIYFRAQNLK
jgi:flagellar basal body-associated protein FliL